MKRLISDDTRLREHREAPGVFVGDEVEVPLPVPNLHVLQAVPLLRERPDRLAEHVERVDLERDLARPGPEHGAADTDPVSDIQVFQDFVGFIQQVGAEHRLHRPVLVPYVHEGDSAHVTDRHDAARHHEFFLGTAVLERVFYHNVPFDGLGDRVRPPETVREWIDSPGAQPLQLFKAHSYKVMLFGAGHPDTRAVRPTT